MVSSYTTNKAFDKPANGDYVDTWNIPVNADWDIADKAFGGTYSVALTNANVTLTQANCQNVRIRFTGALSGNIIIYFPAGVSGFFIVQNATTGTYSITLASAGGAPGTTVLTEQGRTTFVFSDGSNVFYADDSRIQLTAGTGIQITGTSNFTISLITPVAVANGGTGLSSYTIGDLVYASGATTLSKLADVATGNALISGGVGVAPSYGKIGLTTHITGTLAIANGGTGQTTATNAFDALAPTTTAGDLIYNNGTDNIRLAIGSANYVLTSTGSAPAWGQVSLTAGITGTLPVGNGGTGLTSYTVGDIVYASGATTLASLADVATGNALISGGVGVAPSYGKIGLTTHVTGTLAAGNGGTGISSYTTGDILYASGASTIAALADVATGNALISGGVGVAPAWGKVGLTTHVTGTLPVANGGTGVTTSTGTGNVVLSASPALTGTPTAPTAAGGTNTTQIATTQFVTSAVAAAAAGAVPSGVIMLWSGSIASIPSGWALCNGASGTPDLRNRFIVGAGSTYAVAATGGADTVTLTSSQIPAHTHTFSATTSTDGLHTHSVTDPGHSHTYYSIDAVSTGAVVSGGGFGLGYTGTSYTGISLVNAGSHTHTVSGTTGSAGTGGSHENRPPYYALAYIMKL